MDRSSPRATVGEAIAHRDRLPHTRTSLFLRAAFTRFAAVLAWVWVLLLVVVVLNVSLRYLFGEGRIAFEEIQWHLYAVGFLLALAPCLDADDHVRVDVLRARWPLRIQAWVELYGLVLLFFPFVLMVLVLSLPFVAYAWQSGEVSSAPGGLPLRWAIKAVIPLAMALLLAAGVGRLTRVSACLFGTPEPMTLGGEGPLPADDGEPDGAR